MPGLPTALHLSERDHQHLKGRVRAMRGFQALAGAREPRIAHASLRNLHGRFYDFGWTGDETVTAPKPPMLRAWDALTAELLVR